MGGGRWTSEDWSGYSARHVAFKATTADIYTNTAKGVISDALDPKNVKMRESRDSSDNPESAAIIVALDVTGSMSPVLDKMARVGLPSLMEGIYGRKPVENPQVMFMGVGDVTCDKFPLQVSQFESDIRIAEQLTQLYLEQGGGGNDSESYTLPWYFAAMHTSIDCFEKRNKKGYLFTIGDENIPDVLKAEEIGRVLGYTPEQRVYTADELYKMVSRKYHVFHLMVEQGSHYRYNGDAVKKSWMDVIGQNAIPLDDHSKLGEVIISLIQVKEGADKKTVVDSWDGSTALTVKRAVDGLTPDERAMTAGVIVL